MIKKGDTLVEVCIAIGIFSLIAIGVASVMSSGTSGTQTALETTLAREEIDAQAEALRFIQSSYIVNHDSDDNAYKTLWRTITEHAVDPSESVVQYNPSTCSAPYTNGDLTKQNAFILNTRALGSESTLGSSYISFRNTPNKFSQTLTYPRLIFGSSDTADNLLDPTTSNNLYKAEGIYVVAVRDKETTNLITERKNASAVSAFYDFYIRTCWYGTDSERPTTISTVIRLYDPDEVSTVAQENIRDQVTIKYNNPSNYPPENPLSYTTQNILAGETKNLANPAASLAYGKYHRFLCWGVNSSNCNSGYASGAPYKAPNKGEFNDQNRFINLYAIWNTEKFSVTYNANGGAFANNVSAKTEYCDIFSDCELSYTIPVQYFSTPTRDKYRIIGWSTNPNATTPDFTQVSPVVGPLYTTKDASGNESKGKVNLYAVWKSYYYITYDANGGSGTKTDTCIPLDPCESDYTISYFSGISRAGYSFLGWSTNQNAATPDYTKSTSIGKLTGNLTLYAVWKPYFYITYDANGGLFTGNVATKTDSCPPVNACATSSYTIPSGFFSGISRSGGYSFLGWSTNKNAVNPDYTSGSAGYGKITSNITFYAVWKSYYYITFDAGSGSFSDGKSTRIESCPPTDTCASGYTIPSSYVSSGSNTPTRSGYSFLGWSKTANPTSAEYTTSTSIGALSGNVRLYAAWKEKNETYHIELRWGANIDYDSYIYGKKADGTAFYAYYGEKKPEETVSGVTRILASLDHDCTGSCQDETFEINTLGGRDFYFYVRNYTNGDTISGATVTVKRKTASGGWETVKTYSSGSASGSGRVWNVFAYKNGAIVDKNAHNSSSERSGTDGALLSY